MHSKLVPLLVAFATAACVFVDDEDDERSASASQPTRVSVATSGGSRAALTAEQIERGRHDDAWRRAIARDAGGATAASVRTDSAGASRRAGSADNWERISADAVNAARAAQVDAEAAGPAILRTQVLLDRALFSPGVIDGRWGKNTEKAIYWLQSREGLPVTGELDARTDARLVALAGAPAELVRAHTLTEEDVRGPFVDIPDDMQQAARLECMCYESLEEKLAERFHTTRELLAQLNEGIELGGLSAGTRLTVPAVRTDTIAPGANISAIRVSDGGSFVHALDSQGRIVFHFPSTLGSSYDPTGGDWHVVSVTRDPWWHYQPAILDDVPDDEPEARIPPGPNNAVGTVWIELSREHYGIHGTDAPETIGYATSSGCVRLTNWDAVFLSRHVQQHTPVRFTEPQ